MMKPTQNKEIDCILNSLLWTFSVIFLSIMVYLGLLFFSKMYPNIITNIAVRDLVNTKNLVLISMTLISSVFIEYLFSDYKIENKVSQSTVIFFVFINYLISSVIIIGTENNIKPATEFTRTLLYILLTMTTIYSIGMRYVMFRKNY